MRLTHLMTLDRRRRLRHVAAVGLAAFAISSATAIGSLSQAQAFTGAWRCTNWPMSEYCWGGSGNRHNWTQGKVQNESGWVTQVCMIIEEFGGSHQGTKHDFCPTTLVDPGAAETWRFGTAYSSGWPLGAGGGQACVSCDDTTTDFLNVWTG